MTFRVPRTGLFLLLPLFFAAADARRTAAQTVPDPTVASEIRIVSPADGETFGAAASIRVQVEGQDIPNVGHLIELYKDSERVGVIVLDPLVPIRTTPVLFDFTFTLDPLRAGKYTLTAAIDGSRSEPVHIEVRKRIHRHRR